MAVLFTMGTAAAMLGELNHRLAALQVDSLRARFEAQDAKIAAAVQAARARASHDAVQPHADVRKPPKPEILHGDKPDRIDTWCS